ncbi:MAG: methyltransferase domain-containing protein [Anaerolineales bacterium]|nr:MAG: methyltransferase domain-containing protein [Anaerolineales bacterium]
MSISRLKGWLAHPLTRGRNIDSPETTALRRQIIDSKPFLKRIYEDWYSKVAEAVHNISTTLPLLELGSGAGFLAEKVPKLITSEIFFLEGMKIILDAQCLPFAAGSLNGIVMTNVLHHIPEPALLFREGERCIVPRGKIIMIEPWLTSWSRFVYKNLHHEPVDEANTSWKIDGEGPLSAANTALPWILFARDRKEFIRRFPSLQIKEVTPFMPFRYLLSGGISLRNIFPGWSHGFFRLIEFLLSPLRNQLGMFAKIVLIHKPKDS